jgi:hypothetical protein
MRRFRATLARAQRFRATLLTGAEIPWDIPCGGLARAEIPWEGPLLERKLWDIPCERQDSVKNLRQERKLAHFELNELETSTYPCCPSGITRWKALGE